MPTRSGVPLLTHFPLVGGLRFHLFVLQRHLEAYRNMHRLRDALYKRYAALLKDKVHLQRLQLQQRNETEQRARAKSENETKQVNHSIFQFVKRFAMISNENFFFLIIEISLVH